MLNAACEQCRIRKVRCDGAEPCLPCIKSGRKEECCRNLRKARTPKKVMLARRMQQQQNGKRDVEMDVKTEMDSPTAATTTTTTTKANEGERMPSDLPFWPHIERPSFAPSSPSSSSSSAQVRRASSLESVKGRTLHEQAREVLGSEAAAQSVIMYLYYWRTASTLHSCIHVPTVLRWLSQLYREADGQDTLPEIKVVLLVMMIALGLRSIPRKNVPVLQRVKNAFAVIRQTYEGLPSHPRSLAQLSRSFLLQEIVMGGRSLTHMQLICLLLAFDKDGGNSNEQIFDHAVRTMRRWPLDRAGPSVTIGGGITTNAATSIDQEMAIRVWWYLVCRDWMGAVSNGTYAIQASHFSCRLPNDISDEQLDGQKIRLQIPPSYVLSTDYVPVRYSLVMIQFAQMVRRLVDVRIAKSLDLPSLSNEVVREFEVFCINLPDMYSLQRMRFVPKQEEYEIHGERANKILPAESKLITERWLIHQQIFYTLLELHSPITMLAPSRIAIPLAQHILDIRQDTERLCSVTDLFKFKNTNAINACVILLLHLIQAHREGSLTFIGRDLMLRKVRHTLHQARAEFAKDHGEALSFVTELVKMESQAWRDHPLTMPSSSSSFGGMKANGNLHALQTFLDYTPIDTPPVSTTTSATPSTMTATLSPAHNDDAGQQAPSSGADSSLLPPTFISTADSYGQMNQSSVEEQRKEADWFAALPSDVAISPLFQPHAEDPNGARFYDAIRSTLLWTEGLEA